MTNNISQSDFYQYLLIGQSNMAGRGEVRPEDKIIHPRVFSFGLENKWVVAVEPVHFDKKAVGTGPGLVFGKCLAKHYPQAAVGLIPCAVGGTSIKEWAKGELLYQNAIRRVKLAGRNGVLKGILWYQGETDAQIGLEMARQYKGLLDKLFANIYHDLEIQGIPLIVCRIADFVHSDPESKRQINTALETISERIKNSVCITSEGLSHKGDYLHFNSESYCELGKRFAKAIIDFDN